MSAEDEDRKAAGLFKPPRFLCRARVPSSESITNLPFASSSDGKYVSARRHRKGHPESGEKARSIKGVWPKAEIRPNPATKTSETVRTHPQR